MTLTHIKSARQSIRLALSALEAELSEEEDDNIARLELAYEERARKYLLLKQKLDK